MVNEAIQAQSGAILADEGEDPEGWLDVDPMDLDQSLKRYQRKEDPAQTISKDHDELLADQDDDEDMVANEQAGRLKDLAEKMEGFVEGEGAMEGALFDE